MVGGDFIKIVSYRKLSLTKKEKKVCIGYKMWKLLVESCLKWEIQHDYDRNLQIQKGIMAHQ